MFEDHQYKQFPENLLLSKIFRLVLARFWNLKSSARLSLLDKKLGSARQKTGSDTSLVNGFDLFIYQPLSSSKSLSPSEGARTYPRSGHFLILVIIINYHTFLHDDLCAMFLFLSSLECIQSTNQLHYVHL